MNKLRHFAARPGRRFGFGSRRFGFGLLALAALLAVLVVSPRPASAELVHGSYDYPSPIAFGAQLGTQIGLGGYTPGGFKLALDYTHRFARFRDGQIGLWFFADVDLAVGLSNGVCFATVNGQRTPYECDGIGYGSDFEIKSGLQMTFRTPVPLLPYVRAGIALAVDFGRQCDDTGVAVPLAVVGGGARYFLTRHVAVSVGADIHLGPAFYSGGDQGCFAGDHNELWRSLSLLVGAQYAL